MEGSSAWKWNAKRKQFYYHVFSEQQPDFNLRNPTLVEQLKVGAMAGQPLKDNWKSRTRSNVIT